MSADRVIKSNAGIFNSETWAGGIWRRNSISARGDNIQAAIGSSSEQKYPADRKLPKPTATGPAIAFRQAGNRQGSSEVS